MAAQKPKTDVVPVQDAEIVDETGRALDSIAIDVAPSTLYSEEKLRNIQSFADAFTVAESQAELLDASDVIGDGFSLLKSKDRLIGQETIWLEWTFRPGDFGRPYISAYVVSRDPQTGHIGKWVVNDGSTGIAEQLATITKNTGRRGGLIAKNGLRKSEYDTDVNGMPTNDKSLATGRGATHYIDTSA